MPVLNLNNIKKSYGNLKVLKGFSLNANKGEKIALIGPNGSGKTTIFNIINGIESIDEGNLSIKNQVKVGCLQQIPEFSEEKTLWEELKTVFRDVILLQNRINALEKEISNIGENINNKSGENKKLNKLMDKYSKLRKKFEDSQGYEYKSKIRQVAIGLGFTHEELNNKVKTLSGGEKTRLGLVELLLTDPDLLLLDEPTNHLDISSIQWLENYLRTYEGTVIIISHDRYFLDEVVERIVELKNGKEDLYYGNYSYYLKERKKRYERRLQTYKNQQKKINKMEEAIERLRRWGKQGDNPKFFRRARSMEKELEKMEKVEKPTLGGNKINLELNIDKRSGDEVIKIDNLFFSYGNKTICNNLNLNVYWQDKIGIIGKNGCGKTTLLNIIMNRLKSDRGDIKIGASVKIGYYSQEFDGFNPEDEVLTAFRREVPMKTGEARNLLATFLFTGDDVFKKVKNLSGGEKRRLRLLQLMNGNYNLLLMDEPTNHLDLPAREVLEKALNNYSGTLVIVSHDRYFLNKTIDYIYEFEKGSLIKYFGDYDYYREKKEELKENNSENNKEKTENKNNDYFKMKQRRRKESKRKRRINNIEENIIELEERKKQLEREMTAEKNLQDFELLNDLNEEYKKVKEKIEELYSEWEKYL